MKEIFVGSSKEALGQATQVADVLSRVEGVRPLLWTECFKLGDITFTSIEKLAPVSYTHLTLPTNREV